MHFVYWIHLKHENDYRHFGYIGVTNNFNRRYTQHTSGCGSIVVYNKLNTHHEDVVVEFIFKGSEEDCYEFEHSIRPTKNIGWNIAEGGGKPPSGLGDTQRYKKISEKKRGVPLSTEHKLKISKSLTGTKKSKDHVRKVHQSRKDHGFEPWNKGLTTGTQSSVTIDKRRKSMMGKNAKAVTTPSGSFKSVREAAKADNVSSGTILNRIKKNGSQYYYNE